ncbi:MAG: hypothetical protein WA628_02530 [Terriglobales bacterium]
MRRSLMGMVVAGALAAFPACSKHQPAPRETSNPLDHVDSSHAKPINFLHKTFTVKKFAQFPIEVPPHTVIPRIHGTFKSFVPRPGDDDLSDDSTDVGFLLMNSEQFADYSHSHGGGTALYTVEASHDHEVEFVLPPTKNEAEKYYVVFFNSPGGAATKSVEADFTLSFGY